MGLPRWLNVKESACQAEDMISIPRSGRSTGEENGNPLLAIILALQYSSLRNTRDREVWQATVHSVAKSQTQLSTC